MDRRNKKPSRFNIARKWLIFWTLFIGLGAVAGGLSMILDPSGKTLHMDGMLPYFQKLPFAKVLFQDFLFSGFALLIVNGLTNLTAALLLLRKKKLGVILGGIFGITLMLWICIQFYMFELNFMSTAYFIFGLCQAVTGYTAWNLLRREEKKSKSNKILVLGSCGAGKSTFARRLHEITGLPLIHLDLVWWRPDATHVSREEFDRKLEEIISGDRWIIDGDYSRTYETRIRACDTVIFLDYDEETCLRGLSQRIGQKRPDIPWVEQRLEPELVEMVHRYKTDSRPKLLALLTQFPDKQAVIFHTREESNAWLEKMETTVS